MTCSCWIGVNLHLESQMEWLRENSVPQHITHLLCQSLHGGNIDTASLRILQQHPQDGKLSTDGLPAARGGPDKHVIITVVHGVENWKSKVCFSQNKHQQG